MTALEDLKRNEFEKWQKYFITALMGCVTQSTWENNPGAIVVFASSIATAAAAEEDRHR